jgi:hypothetical protein
VDGCKKERQKEKKEGKKYSLKKETEGKERTNKQTETKTKFFLSSDAFKVRCFTHTGENNNCLVLYNDVTLTAI